MGTDNARAADETTIRILLEDHAAALRVKDADGVLSHRTAEFVQFSLAPPLRSAADKNGLQSWFATWQGPLGYEIRETRIVIGDDVAFGYGFVRLSGTKTDGTWNDLWFRQTIGFRRIAGASRIVHEHDSVPFYMDGSLRAAVDLKP
jgi:PhnB protein